MLAEVFVHDLPDVISYEMLSNQRCRNGSLITASGEATAARNSGMFIYLYYSGPSRAQSDTRWGGKDDCGSRDPRLEKDRSQGEEYSSMVWHELNLDL